MYSFQAASNPLKKRTLSPRSNPRAHGPVLSSVPLSTLPRDVARSIWRRPCPRSRTWSDKSKSWTDSQITKPNRDGSKWHRLISKRLRRNSALSSLRSTSLAGDSPRLRNSSNHCMSWLDQSRTMRQINSITSRRLSCSKRHTWHQERSKSPRERQRVSTIGSLQIMLIRNRNSSSWKPKCRSKRRLNTLLNHVSSAT